MAGMWNAIPRQLSKIMEITVVLVLILVMGLVVASGLLHLMADVPAPTSVEELKLDFFEVRLRMNCPAGTRAMTTQELESTSYYCRDNISNKIIGAMFTVDSHAIHVYPYKDGVLSGKAHKIVLKDVSIEPIGEFNNGTLVLP